MRTPGCTPAASSGPPWEGAEEEARSRPATTSSASSKLFARTNAATRELNVSSVARMPWRSMRARTRRRRSVSRTTP